MSDGKSYSITLDDDPMIHRVIEAATGLRSLPFSSVASLRSRGQRYTPIAAFVDIQLGENETGLDLIPDLRAWWPFCPILVITASPGDDIIGMALAAGANDYIRKPIGAKELSARLHARSIEMQERCSREQIKIGDSTLDLVRRCLTGVKGHRYLSDLDARLLTHLARVPETLLSRLELKRALWGSIRVSDNALDKRLCELRQALRDVGGNISLVSTYGKGVRLSVQEERDAA